MIDFARRFPPESGVGRWLRAPLRWVSNGRVVRVLSGPARGLKWVAGAGLAGCWLGTYELAKARRFAAVIGSGETVWDVGANVGYYSVVAARRVGPAGRVFAFEPFKANYDQLVRHLALNGLGQVTAMEVAMGGHDGVARFAEGGSGFEGRLDARGGREVRCVRGDTLVAGGDVLVPSVVKIDVEGAELEVLKGGESMLRSRMPTIFLATHGEAIHRACLGMLSSWGYGVEPLEEGQELDACDEVIATPRRPRGGRG